MTRGRLHEDLVRREAIDGPSDRSFGLTIAILCAIVGLVRLVLGHAHSGWWLGVALVLALLALGRPALLGPLNWLWLRFGLLLCHVVNPVVMALLFVTTMTPIGLLMRLCGKDPLRLRLDPAATSYWLPREPPGPEPRSLRNQF